MRPARHSGMRTLTVPSIDLYRPRPRVVCTTAHRAAIDTAACNVSASIKSAERSLIWSGELWLDIACDSVQSTPSDERIIPLGWQRLRPPCVVGFAAGYQVNAMRCLAMTHPYWNDWYFSWGMVSLWFGCHFLMFSSIGNWGYTYRAHQDNTVMRHERTRSIFWLRDTREERSPGKNTAR